MRYLTEKIRKTLIDSGFGMSESTIYYDPPYSLMKIYKNKNRQQLYLIAKKVSYLIEHIELKNYVVLPTDMIYDEWGFFIGYQLPYLMGAYNMSDWIQMNAYDDLLIEEMFAKVSKKLRQLHGMGIIVYDFNLYNILITRNGEPMFIDLEGGKIGQFPASIVSSLLYEHYQHDFSKLLATRDLDCEALLLAYVKALYYEDIVVWDYQKYHQMIDLLPISDLLCYQLHTLKQWNNEVKTVFYLDELLEKKRDQGVLQK